MLRPRQQLKLAYDLYDVIAGAEAGPHDAMIALAGAVAIVLRERPPDDLDTTLASFAASVKACPLLQCDIDIPTEH